jgi:uncharacterized integral membrane protein
MRTFQRSRDCKYHPHRSHIFQRVVFWDITLLLYAHDGVFLCTVLRAHHLSFWGVKQQMTETKGLRKMTKVKIIVIVIVLLLSLIVFIQNRQAVDTKVLFLTITMPLVLLLILTFIMGSILGLLIASHTLREPRKPPSPGDKQ